MSAIYKLSIQGIRSFDSNDRETIEFGKPLTLIVGSNGSGKTTIIECLKYATTGDLPPNSKGGAFVHDPKITGEKDIRAQVKLAFTSANGLNMIVTRNIQLLVKKSSNTFKTLEGQLVSVTQNGDRSTLSTRTTELDTQVPLYMGVPKAILEYVIFCHQEDSLWPLSEPANLKKKFDEIFQAMKFTKALDNLKVIKKDMSVDIKLLKQSVEHLKVDKDRSKVTKMNIEKLKHKCDVFRMHVKEIENKLIEITKQSDDVFESNQDFQKILASFENSKRNKVYITDQITRLTESIDVIDSPIEEIEEQLSIFDKEISKKSLEIESFETHINDLKSNAYNLQSNSDLLFEKQGKLKSYHDIYLNNVESLKKLKEKNSASYNIDLQKSNESYVQDLRDLYDNHQKELASFNKGFSEKIKILSDKKAELDYNLVVQLQQLEYNKMDKSKLSETLQNLNIELSKIQYSKEELDQEVHNLDKFITKLKDLESNDGSSDLNNEIQKANDEMILLENQLENLQEKIMKTNQQSDLYAKLSLLKRSAGEKQLQLEKNNNTLKSNAILKNDNITIDENSNSKFTTYVNDLQKKVEIKEKNVQKLSKEHTEAKIKAENSSNELIDKESKIKALELKLQETLPEDCPIDEYDDALLESESSYKTALENLKMHQTTLAFNRKALEIAEQNNCCYLCSRGFDDDKIKSRLLSELKAKTNETFELSLLESVNQEKEYLSSLRALEKDVSTLFNIKEEMDELRVTKESNEKFSQELSEKLQLSEELYLSIRNKLENINSTLRPILEENKRLGKEILELNNDIQTITDELKLYNISSDGVLTVEELQAKQKECNTTLRERRKTITSLQDERELKSKEKSTLITLVKDRTLKVEQIKTSIAKKENLENEQKTKNDDMMNINTRLSSIEEEVELLQGQVSNISQQMTTFNTEYEIEVQVKKDKLSALQKSLEEFNNLHSLIKSFEADGNKELEKCTSELESFRTQLADANKLIETENARLMKIKEELHDSNSRKKNLKDNIELHDLKYKLRESEKEINSVDVENAEKQRDQYQQEISRLRNLYEQLSAENAGKLGEIKQLQNQIDSLTHQLNTDYLNVDNKYHKEWVKLQTKTFITDDINTYSKALDSAIMRYHGLKMQDINRIIDELWKRTYSGTDVDTIQIRSDETGSSTKGKSYNYRVVMYKQDAELDMRGRCSAGQKVLASIIIRLALSETFGINCGVIALDEPTTNLDEENIESLAKSLHNIIQFRQHQKNFQLIVITHDEKFLNNMNAAQFTDHFFKVKRDDRQKSLIEWVDINKVTE